MPAIRSRRLPYSRAALRMCRASKPLVDEARQRGLRRQLAVPVGQLLGGRSAGCSDAGATRNPSRSAGSITFENEPT